MVFALESGSLIKLRKHISIPKGFFSLKIMKGSFWVGECFHVPDVGTPPTPQGTSCAQDPSRPCSMDLLISMFICNLYSIIYNKLVILSFKKSGKDAEFYLFFKLRRSYGFSHLVSYIDWCASIKPSLHSRNKQLDCDVLSSLYIVGFFCQYFIFGIYFHQCHWPISFF